jgi:hypothetical protein
MTSTYGGLSADTSFRVFMCYRRGDSQAEANGLYDGLSHRLPDARLFMDIDSIPVGVDFEEHIRREITVCDVVLVVIGPHWLDVRPGTGTRRIDEPDDYVRLEIESALAAPRATVIPVLVDGAQMPAGGELPPSIAGLARINAVDIDARRWKADLESLSRRLTELQRSRLPQPPQQSNPPPPRAFEHADGFGHPQASHGGHSRGGREWVGWIAAVLPLVSFGLLSFVPPMRAALQRTDSPFQPVMSAVAALLEIMALAGLWILGEAPEDAEGNAVGPWSTIGLLMLVAAVFLACGIGVTHRVPRRR